MNAVQYDSEGRLYIASVALPSIQEDQVLVHVRATAVNRADTLQKRGLYNPPPGESNIIGLEAAGIVSKRGAKCKSFNEGDRVMVLLSGGGNAEFVAAYEAHCLRIPSNLSFTEAAAIPEVWLTAYQLMCHIANLAPNETVLIHAAASGVGTAAVQLAAELTKAKVIATVGSSSKADFVRTLGAHCVINYKEVDDFDNVALKFTQGKGVDVILDCVGGSYWKRNLNAIAVDGRWILYGLLGGASLADGDLLAGVLRKRVRLQGSTLRARSIAYKADLVEDFCQKVLPHFGEGGILRPIVDCVFPLDRIADAHQYVEENRNVGKVVLVVHDDAADGQSSL